LTRFMPLRSRKGKCERAMSKKIEIMRRAAEIFAKKGFSETALQDIAEASGVKREAVYHYFRDKTEILYNIIKPQSEALLESILFIANSSAPPNDKIRKAIRNHLNRFNPNYFEMVVAYRELIVKTNELTELRKIWKEYERVWNDIIEEAQGSGEIRPEFNSKVLTFSILGMCNSLSTWYDPNGEIGLDTIIDLYFSIIWGGIANAPMRTEA
jgi:AcrR family transcriptional regulator